MISRIIKKLIYREKYSSKTYIDYLRKIGVTIGNNCEIFVPTKSYIDTQNPYMITIGDNVKITQGVVLLTHDFSWCVTSNLDGFITGSVGYINIGSNVFIGFNSIILKNVTIGDNVIIGAGSIVTKDCESNSVYAGNPARKIMSIEEYHNKRKQKQESELKILVNKYYDKYGTMPDDNVMREFLFYCSDNSNIDEQMVNRLMHESGHYDKCYNALKHKKSKVNIEDLINK